MKYRILILGAAFGLETGHDKQYVVAYSPPQMGPDGGYLQDTGMLVTSPDPGQAKPFDDVGQAILYYRAENGTRPDGRPNRPLTGYHVEIERYELN